MPAKAVKKHPLPFRVGMRVRLRVGQQRLAARIIEDRGPIGYQGRQLLRIQLTGPNHREEEPFEVPADYIVSAH